MSKVFIKNQIGVGWKPIFDPILTRKTRHEDMPAMRRETLERKFFSKNSILLKILKFN